MSKVSDRLVLKGVRRVGQASLDPPRSLASSSPRLGLAFPLILPRCTSAYTNYFLPLKKNSFKGPLENSHAPLLSFRIFPALYCGSEVYFDSCNP